MSTDKRDILIRLLGEETVAKMSDRAGKGLDRFGDSLEATEKDAKGLDQQIEEVEGSLKALAVAYARTQDAADRLDLTRAMRKQEADLRRLTKARKLVPDLEPEEDGRRAGARFAAKMGEVITQKLARLGEPVGSALSASFSTLPPQAQAALGASVAGMAAAAAPLAGAAIAGAIVGAAGTGGVVGGLALAAKDARVKAAASSVGDTLGDMLSDSASAFVPVAVTQLGKVRSELMSWQPEIKAIFDAAAEYVDPLVEGALGFGRAMLPGIREAVEAGGPFFSMLADELPELGQDVGELFATAAKYADEGAAAVGTLLDTVGFLVDATRYQVSALAEVYGWYLKIEEVVLGSEQIKRFGKLKTESDDAAGGLRGLGDAAAESAREVESLNQAIQRLADENITAEQANMRLEAAIDRAAEAAKRNNDGIDAGTEKGRANREVLIGIAEAAKAASASILAQTGNQDAANAAAARAREAFISAAVGMRQAGVSADKARAEAEKLADQLFAIPPVRHVKVIAETKNASGQLTGFLKQVNALDGRVITVRTRLDRDGEHISGSGKQLKFSAGGPVMGPGAKGVDSVPAVLAPGEHILTASEVDAAGGHAGVERIRAALRGEASAPVLAGTGAPAGGGGGGGHRTYHITVNVPPTANPVEAGRATVEAIRAYEQRNGSGWRT